MLKFRNVDQIFYVFRNIVESGFMLWVSHQFVDGVEYFVIEFLIEHFYLNDVYQVLKSLIWVGFAFYKIKIK